MGHDELIRRIKELSKPELQDIYHLINELLSKRNEEEDSEVEDAWSQEIRKRISEVRSGKVECIPADEVFENIEEEFGWKD